MAVRASSLVWDRAASPWHPSVASSRDGEPAWRVPSPGVPWAGGCWAEGCPEQPGRVPSAAKALIRCQSRQRAGRAQHPPLAGSLWPSSGHEPIRGVSVTSSRSTGGSFPAERDAPGALGVGVRGPAVAGPWGAVRRALRGALHPTAAMLQNPQAPLSRGDPCLGFAHRQGASVLGTCSEDHGANPASLGQVQPSGARCCGWAVPAQPGAPQIPRRSHDGAGRPSTCRGLAGLVRSRGSQLFDGFFFHYRYYFSPSDACHAALPYISAPGSVPLSCLSNFLTLENSNLFSFLFLSKKKKKTQTYINLAQ